MQEKPLGDSIPLEVGVDFVKGLQDQSADFLLLDCREPSEYETASIRGATLIPMGNLPERIGELEPFMNKRIVVHCHHGGRSMRVTQWLRKNGFQFAQNMAGGIDAWSQQIDSNVPRY